VAILEYDNDAILHNESLVDKVRVVLLVLLVDERNVLSNPCVLVNDAFLEDPAQRKRPHYQPSVLSETAAQSVRNGSKLCTWRYPLISFLNANGCTGPGLEAAIQRNK
jgi:hypothetical protein